MARTRTANIVSFAEARNVRSRQADERDEAEELADREGRRLTDSRDQRRRERAKARADRMYSRQFSDSPSMSSTEENAPRPALYEAKMGATHRKSARMQRSSVASAPSAKINPAGWLAWVTSSKRSLKIATGVVCAVLACTFLYVPAQQYYQAQREHDRLVAEYSVIEKRNDVLDVQNDILASDAGMEDAVRQKYGYVKVGEQTAIVTGLSENATDASRASESIEANVLSSSVKAQEEWYTPLLDAFFGVE